MHGLVSDLKLLKNKAEILHSQYQWNIFATNTRASIFCNSQQRFSTFFFLVGDLVACSYISSDLMAYPQYQSAFMWLENLYGFIKTVLIHNGYIKLSVLLGYASYVKEIFDNIKQLLRFISHDHYKCLWFVKIWMLLLLILV